FLHVTAHRVLPLLSVIRCTSRRVAGGWAARLTIPASIDRATAAGRSPPRKSTLDPTPIRSPFPAAATRCRFGPDRWVDGRHSIPVAGGEPGTGSASTPPRKLACVANAVGSDSA